MLKSYRDLRVWQAAMELSVKVYKATDSFPKSEVFGLVSQMRRAASGVPANMAEGFSRQHKPEFVQFLHVAKGSLSELDTFIDLSMRLGYVSRDDSTELTDDLDQIGKMLYGLIESIRQSSH